MDYDETNEEFIIDSYTIELAKREEEFKKYFFNNFQKFVMSNNIIPSSVLVKISKELPGGRELIFSNFELVVSKISDRYQLIQMLNEYDVKENAAKFFTKNNTGGPLAYERIIHALEEKGVGKKEIIDLISDNASTIIHDSGYHLPDVMSLIHNRINNLSDKDPHITSIDKALADNIDTVLNTQYYNEGYKYHHFEKMKKFKSEIKKMADKKIDFLTKFPLNRNSSISDAKEMCEELFGSFDGVDLAAIKLAKGDKMMAVIVGTIINELVDATNENTTDNNNRTSIEDFKKIGDGGYCNVYQVGNYVLKLGAQREDLNIPNHRRILQPLLRGRIIGSLSNKYIEVQNLVDKNWFKKMDNDDVYEILYQIYSELRDSDLVWYDIKPENVGKLRKANRSNLIFMDIDGKKKNIRPVGEATGMIGELPKEDVLRKGDYVIIDTDYIQTYDKRKLSAPSKNGTPGIQEDFEDRYNKEKAERTSNIGNSGYPDL